MTHVKNAESFARLVDFCTGYGAYNPGRPILRLEALIVQRQKLNSILASAISAKALYDDQVNQRKQVFDQLPRLVSSILRTLEASGATAEKLDDARAFAHQITGFISRDRAPVPSPAATEPSGNATAKHSTRQMAFVSQADSFTKLVNAIASEPLYLAYEPSLSKSGLNDKLTQLEALNREVYTSRVRWSNALIERNALMYHHQESVYHIFRAVKKYVRAIYGHDSEQYAQIKKITFDKPR